MPYTDIHKKPHPKKGLNATFTNLSRRPPSVPEGTVQVVDWLDRQIGGSWKLMIDFNSHATSYQRRWQEGLRQRFVPKDDDVVLIKKGAAQMAVHQKELS